MNAIDMMLNGAMWTAIEAPPVADGSTYATHSGVLEIPGFGSCRCWRLSNGRATLDAHDMARLFGFDSPEGLAAEMERLGYEALAAKLKTPIKFYYGAPL